MVKSLPSIFVVIAHPKGKPWTGKQRSENFAACKRADRLSCDSVDMSQTKEVISNLNNLIETLKDGQEGFRQSAEHVQDSELKTLFNSYSLQRSQFAGELQNEVIRLGEPEPEKTSSVAGSLHRAWINLKGALTTADTHAILAECERGEDAAVRAYKDAMEENLPAPLRDLISRQYAEVKSAHDTIRDLRDARAKS